MICTSSDYFLSFSIKWFMRYSKLFCFFFFYRNTDISHIFNTIFRFSTLVERLFSSLWQLNQSGTRGCPVGSVLYCLHPLARHRSQHFTQPCFYCLFSPIFVPELLSQFKKTFFMVPTAQKKYLHRWSTQDWCLQSQTTHKLCLSDGRISL